MSSTQSWSRAKRLLGPVTLEKISILTGLFGLTFLIIVTVVSAWNERRTLFHEAQDHAHNSASFLADHAQRLFEVADIALRSTTLETRGMDWDALEGSAPTWTALREANALLHFVDDLWLNDESGRLRMTTFAFPAPAANAKDRPIFKAVQADDRLVISDRITGTITHKPTFLAARRLANPDGSFRGMVSATLDLTYFTSYWRRLELPNRERIAVVHEGSGDVLIASDDTGGVAPVAAGETHLDIPAGATAGSFVPGANRYGFYHRVGEAPLFLTVEFDRSSVTWMWLVWMFRLAPLACAALLALVSIMLLGLRQARQEAETAREIAAARAALETANQHLEERVAERTADLRESNEEIQRFAYIVSHDLRAPLVNITGFTAELQELKPTLFPASATPSLARAEHDFDEAIGFIRSSSEKMDRLINAILTLSREGRRRFRAEPIDLTALLESIADGVAHRVQRAGAAVRVEPLPTVVSDRIALEQIFSNLVDNAAKYLRRDVPGRIVITGRRIGSRTVVEVADNGRGVDIKDRERVFELFRRAGPQDQPGEGIGLAHVRALVRRLGGRISLEGALGQGSVFTVDLPDLDEQTLMSSAG